MGERLGLYQTHSPKEVTSGRSKVGPPLAIQARAETRREICFAVTMANGPGCLWLKNTGNQFSPEPVGGAIGAVEERSVVYSDYRLHSPPNRPGPTRGDPSSLLAYGRTVCVVSHKSVSRYGWG